MGFVDSDLDRQHGRQALVTVLVQNTNRPIGVAEFHRLHLGHFGVACFLIGPLQIVDTENMPALFLGRRGHRLDRFLEASAACMLEEHQTFCSLRDESPALHHHLAHASHSRLLSSPTVGQSKVVVNPVEISLDDFLTIDHQVPAPIVSWVGAPKGGPTQGVATEILHSVQNASKTCRCSF